MYVTPQNSWVEGLTRIVIVFGDGGLWQVIRSLGWPKADRISALIRNTRDLDLSLYYVKIQ